MNTKVAEYRISLTRLDGDIDAPDERIILCFRFADAELVEQHKEREALLHAFKAIADELDIAVKISPLWDNGRMTISLTRRGFLQALGFGAVAAAVPTLIEPRRKIWQVGADIGGRIRVTDIECTVNGKPLMASNEGWIRLRSQLERREIAMPSPDIGDGLANANEAFTAQFNEMLAESGHEPYAAYDMPNGSRVVLESSPPVDDRLRGFDGAELFKVSHPYGAGASYSNRLTGQPLTHENLKRAFAQYEAMIERDPIAQVLIEQRVRRT